MTTSTASRTADLLTPRCAHCGEVLPEGTVINYGDIQFHLECAPACSGCARELRAGEGGWRSQGVVTSAPWGWSVRPTEFWCPDCLSSAPRYQPRGID